MNNPQPSPDAGPRERSSLPRAAQRLKFQFTLRTLMIAVTLIAIYLGLAVSVGEWLAVLLFVAVGTLWLTMLVSCLLWARGTLRVFAVGAAVPSACILWFGDGDMLLGEWAAGLLLLVIGLGLLSGEASVIIYRWLERNDWQWPGEWPWPRD